RTIFPDGTTDPAGLEGLMPNSRIALGISGTLTVGACACFVAVARPPSPARTPAVTAPERHYVTPRQLTATGALARAPVGLETATDHHGQTVRWSELTADRPLVVVFIKDGCPCNVEF